MSTIFGSLIIHEHFITKNDIKNENNNDNEQNNITKHEYLKYINARSQKYGRQLLSSNVGRHLIHNIVYE